MKKVFLLSCILTVLLSISAVAATPNKTIDTSQKTVVYQNTFDDADSIKDFTQHNGEWGVSDGKVRLLSYTPSEVSSETYIFYTGADSSIRHLSDYVVEVDLYNVQTKAGLLTGADAYSTSTAATIGSRGYTAFVSLDGTKGVLTRPVLSQNNSLTVRLTTSASCFKPGDNLHIEMAVRGTIYQFTISDLTSGTELLTWSGVNEEHTSGTFGLMANTKVYNNTLDCRNCAFDNLTVSSLPALPNEKAFTLVSGGLAQSGTDLVVSVSQNTLAVHKEVTLEEGTVQANVFLPKQATVFQPEKEQVGIVFNHSKAEGSYYKLVVTDHNNLSLFKVQKGKEQELKKTSLSYMSLHEPGASEIRAVFKNGSIHCYFNGKCLLRYQDKGYLRGTGVGIFASMTDASILNFETSTVSTPDKADIVIFGQAHMQNWIRAGEALADYGTVANLGVQGSTVLYWSNLINEISSYDANIVIVMLDSSTTSESANKTTLSTLNSIFITLRRHNPSAKIFLVTEWLLVKNVQTLNNLFREYAAEPPHAGWIKIIEGHLEYDILSERTLAALEAAGVRKLVGVTLRMTLGKTDYTLNGEAKTMDVAPIIANERTMLPVRYVAEALGATFEWDGATSTPTLKTADTEIKITVGASEALVNGKAVPLDSPAFIENSRTYMPVRFVAETLGATVEWDAATSTATITK